MSTPSEAKPQNQTTVSRPVSKRHCRELSEGSGLSSDVVEARGYESVTDASRLRRLGFSKRQARVPGLLIPSHGVGGEVVGHQFKPDKPRTDDDGRLVKYESPKGSTIHLDVPPASLAGLADATVPLWVTEGAKKADAGATAGLCCIALSGVQCWRTDEWDAVPLDGRRVFIAFDSDVMTKPEVQSALDALTLFLAGRGGAVSWVLLPPGPSLAGEISKVGLDDWLVAHGMDPAGLEECVVRPETNIKTNGVALKTLTRQAITALHQWNQPERLFERHGILVEAQAGGITEVNKDRLTFLLSEAANWFRVSTRGDDVVRVPVSPPKDVVTNVYSAGPELWRLNRLDRIVTTPVFAPDGSLRTEPGYHRASRSFYIPPDGLVVPKVPREPTKKQVAKAKALIDDLFVDFQFGSPADRAHAWAMLLQPFARELGRVSLIRGRG